MKYTFLIFFIFLFPIYNFGQGYLKIEQPILELRNLKADNEPHVNIFKIKNTGNKPVIIRQISSMSALINVNWDKEPIAPGKNGEIKVTYISEKFQTNFNYKILIYSNAKNSETEISLMGNLVDNPNKPTLLYKCTLSNIKFKVSNINFGNIYTSEKKTDTIYYINLRKKPVTLSIYKQPKHLNIQFIPKTVDSGKKGAMIVTYDASIKNDFGYCYEFIQININGFKDFRNRLTLTAKLQEDFSHLTEDQLKNAPVATIEKRECDFGNIIKGDKAYCSFILKNTGKSPLHIRKTKTTCGCTAVALTKNTLQPGEYTTINIIFDSTGKSGRQYKTISVITNDPKNTEIKLNINGNIKTK